MLLSAQEWSRQLAAVLFCCCSKNCQNLSRSTLRQTLPTGFPLNITHVLWDESLVTGRYTLIETVTCDELGGLQFILQSNLLPGINCTVSWTSGISSASSFSDFITSSLWNRDNSITSPGSNESRLQFKLVSVMAERKINSTCSPFGYQLLCHLQKHLVYLINEELINVWVHQFYFNWNMPPFHIKSQAPHQFIYINARAVWVAIRIQQPLLKETTISQGSGQHSHSQCYGMYVSSGNFIKLDSNFWILLEGGKQDQDFYFITSLFLFHCSQTSTTFALALSILGRKYNLVLQAVRGKKEVAHSRKQHLLHTTERQAEHIHVKHYLYTGSGQTTPAIVPDTV